jgi:hypothetical protein
MYFDMRSNLASGRQTSAPSAAGATREKMRVTAVRHVALHAENDVA